MRLVLILLVLSTTFHCQRVPAPTPTPPNAPTRDVVQPPITDAAAEPSGDVFDRACEVLDRFTCEEGTRRPGEDTCANVMRRAELRKLTQLHPDCVAAAGSVAEIKKCGRYCANVAP